jgi:hypothetical protein
MSLVLPSEALSATRWAMLSDQPSESLSATQWAMPLDQQLVVV